MLQAVELVPPSNSAITIKHMSSIAALSILACHSAIAAVNTRDFLTQASTGHVGDEDCLSFMSHFKEDRKSKQPM